MTVTCFKEDARLLFRVAAPFPVAISSHSASSKQGAARRPGSPARALSLLFILTLVVSV